PVRDAPHQASVGEHPVSVGGIRAFLVIAQPPSAVPPWHQLAVTVRAAQVDPDAQRVGKILWLLDPLRGRDKPPASADWFRQTGGSSLMVFKPGQSTCVRFADA